MQDLEGKQPLQDFALVFDDIVVSKLATHRVIDSILRFMKLVQAVGSAPAQQLSTAVMSLLGRSHSTPESVDPEGESSVNHTLQHAQTTLPIDAGSAAAVAQFALESQHMKILKGLRQRIGQGSRSVNLMYNASAYHVLPAALSGMWQPWF